MGENGRLRSALPPVVTMNWCSTCATPLPSDWETCPGCELYGTAIEALDDYDSARAAARLLEHDCRVTELAEAGTAFSMRMTEAVSELRLRRMVHGRAMNDTFLMLGIESSCDETAAALVKSDGTILASEIASQMEVHAAHGGVVVFGISLFHLQQVKPL